MTTIFYLLQQINFENERNNNNILDGSQVIDFLDELNNNENSNLNN